MPARPRRPAGLFLAPNGRTRHTPLREVATEGRHDPDRQHAIDQAREEDRLREAEIVAARTDHRDEPEGIGPAILTSYAEVNRRILTQHTILEVAAAQERRPELTPQNRLDTVHARAKHAHVDLSHPIHLVQRAIDKARMRAQPVNPNALARLEGLEALLDGVKLQSLAA